MENNVLSWAKALERGCEPRAYPYTIDEVPMGEYEALLDFKIWSQKVMGINCYFTQVETGKKFRLTVYREASYRIRGVDINFATCPVGARYKIRVRANQKKNTVFEYAELL